MTTVLSVLLMIASVILVIAVTLQEPKTDGLGTLAGQETYPFFIISNKANLSFSFLIGGFTFNSFLSEKYI